MHPRIDSFLLRLEEVLAKYELALRSIGSGFLLGRFTNEINDQNQTVLAALRGTFDASSRDNNVLSWLALAVIVLLPHAMKRLARFNRKRQRTDVLAGVLGKYRAPGLEGYGGVAWGTSITLQSAPNIHMGWRHDEVTFDHRPQHYTFDAQTQETYQVYCRDHHERLRLKHDGTKLSLTRNPASFLDSPEVVLATRLARYSQCKFKEEVLAADAAWRAANLAQAIDGSIAFPHSLCLHAIVTTSDDKVLVTKRSNKVSYYPGCWSCSLEEQMMPEDLAPPGESVILSWAHRMLDEELGVRPSELSPDDVRVMSVFVETDIMNVALCACISLSLESQELDHRLRLLPRKDNEFVDWQFMAYEELVEELRSPTNRHHGSTGYRILFALIRRYGDTAVLERTFRKHGFAA